VAAAHRGKKPTKESRIKMSLAKGGSGDLEKMKCTQNGSERQAWTQAVLRSDNYTCQACGARKSVAGRLNADHILPWSEFPELRFDVSNGRTLCVPCHKKTPTYGHRQAKRVAILARVKREPSTFNVFYDI